MAPLMDTGALKHTGATATASALASMLSAAAVAAVAPLPFSASATAAMDMTTDSESDDDEMQDAAHALNVLELPAVVLELVCAFVDHATLHAVEQTSMTLREVVEQSDLWEQIGSRHVVCLEATTRNSAGPWKMLTCLASRRTDDHAKLLHDVVRYSSADRSSETPANTLTPSRCWAEIQPYLEGPAPQHLNQVHNIAHYGMTLGERIQHTCGCSTGNSCYWSSSASSDKHASDYIDYTLEDACVVSCVQILPYRVFWHPGSPTYAPEKVAFEFYDGDALALAMSRDAATAVTPFYQSPTYDVVNDMRLQSFTLPHKVIASGGRATVLRVKLLGRHQAQTFELPPWLQRTAEDRLPKYYCCLSYVGVLGAVCAPVEHKQLELVGPLKEQSLRMANSLAEYMTSCYEGILEMRRRGQ